LRSFLILVLVAVVLVTGSTTDARAVASVFHPELLRALEVLDHGEGPEAYGAVDRIWSLWDRADPAHIEEALLGAAASKKLSAEARVYAGVLAAFARYGSGKGAGLRQQLPGRRALRQRGQGRARPGVRA
jgi:hypothetical protein